MGMKRYRALVTELVTEMIEVEFEAEDGDDLEQLACEAASESDRKRSFENIERSAEHITQVEET